MADSRQEHYFKTRADWRVWLQKNHATSSGIYLILYRVASKKPSLRWEEAVKEALCFGWIDSTVKRLDEERRRQYFCPRKPKSSWSRVNKNYIGELREQGMMHSSGWLKIETAIKDGSWTFLDDVEDLIIPEDLQQAFEKQPEAHKNYEAFSKTYKKSYLYWLNQARREATRQKRITSIVSLCAKNIRSRDSGWGSSSAKK